MAKNLTKLRKKFFRMKSSDGKNSANQDGSNRRLQLRHGNIKAVHILRNNKNN